MARAMLAYTKEILEKVSFDSDLFFRELNKALNMLLPHEIEELYFHVVQMATVNPQLRSSLYLFRP